MTTVNDALKKIKDGGVKYLDLRFTDPRGKLQHLTMDCSVVDESLLKEGVFFDGSSIAGWKAINESDMVLRPDLSTTVMDPFTAQPTMMVFCDILDAVTKESIDYIVKMLTYVYVTGFPNNDGPMAKHNQPCNMRRSHLDTHCQACRAGAFVGHQK